MTTNIEFMEEIEKYDEKRILNGSIPKNLISPTPKAMNGMIENWNKSQINFRQGIYLFTKHEWFIELGYDSLHHFFSSNILNKSAKECYKNIARADIELTIFDGDFSRIGTIIDSHLDVIRKLCKSDNKLLEYEIIRSIYLKVTNDGGYNKGAIKASDFKDAYEAIYNNDEIQSRSNIPPKDITESKEPDLDEQFEESMDQLGDSSVQISELRAQRQDRTQKDDAIIVDNPNQYVLTMQDLESLEDENYHTEIFKIVEGMIEVMTEVDITNIVKEIMEQAYLKQSKNLSYQMFDFITHNTTNIKSKRVKLNSLIQGYLEKKDPLKKV